MALTDVSSFGLSCSIARMTGYFGSIATNENIPNYIRMRMFEKLIEEFTMLDPQGDLSQQWIAEWQGEIEKIQAKVREENLASRGF